MEREIRINGLTGNAIYGRLKSPKNGSSNKLVIHIHNITHNMRHYLEMMSAEYFSDANYDHFRFSFYDKLPDSLCLSDSTLSTHVSDLRQILEYFRNHYDEIYISAHGLGALVALIANPQGIKAISMWDPTFDLSNFWASGNYLKYNEQTRQYQLDYGNVFVLGAEMVDEIGHYSNENCLELAEEMKTPVQLIIPEESILLNSPNASPEQYTNKFAGKFEIKYLKGSNHTFTGEGNRQELFKATAEWFGVNK